MVIVVGFFGIPHFVAPLAVGERKAGDDVFRQ